MATLRFLKDAKDDYEELDGSQRKWVKAALHRLEERVGKREDLEVYITAGKRMQSISAIYVDLANWHDQLNPKD